MKNEKKENSMNEVMLESMQSPSYSIDVPTYTYDSDMYAGVIIMIHLNVVLIYRIKHDIVW